jgi:hypothetical protein
VYLLGRAEKGIVSPVRHNALVVAEGRKRVKASRSTRRNITSCECYTNQNHARHRYRCNFDSLNAREEGNEHAI